MEFILWNSNNSMLSGFLLNLLFGRERNSLNSYVWDNICIHEFIKQVFPKFCNPLNPLLLYLLKLI